MKEMVYTNEQIIDVLDEGAFDGFDYCIVSFGFNPCAYVRLPESHKLYGNSREIEETINCHGAITYADNELLTMDNEHHKYGYWIGWDYAHFDDHTGYRPDDGGKKWTTAEILDEVKEVIKQLKED